MSLGDHLPKREKELPLQSLGVEALERKPEGDDPNWGFIPVQHQ
jgi:hypothetical protein